jgi:putative ATP-dependent endonuclease of OLD family
VLLRSVRLENFRAVRSAKISFDRTTLLIGENDCGRSSIMEAIALALGWTARDGEFLFQPFHIHRALDPKPGAAAPIRLTLEFGESTPEEWDDGGFAMLRHALPDAVGANRRFWLEVTYDHTGRSQWSFGAAGHEPLWNDGALLSWLRRRMPVLWLTEGMLTARRDASSVAGLGEDSEQLAALVSRHYRDLLEGTAQDVSAAIEGGSTAARQLLLAQAKLLPGHMLPLGEVLEEITGRRSAPAARSSAEALQGSGTAAHKIGLLLLVGALLRSGASQVGQGSHPLTMIDNPEAHLHPMTLASICSVIDRIGGQKIIATHSGALLSTARLSSVRRLTRHAGCVKEWRVPEGVLTADELRRYSYHLRSRRASASFARCWLLVEGETEFWLMSELARVCGYEFESEGVTCVEFAQCGLGALVKVAQQFGIEWHLLADGDTSGQQYAQSARRLAGTGGADDRISVLQDADLEHCFWRFGYDDVFRRAAYPGYSAGNAAQRSAGANAVIRRAIERRSKPYLAVLLLDAVIDRGPEGVPPVLRRAIEMSVRLARGGHGRADRVRASVYGEA